MAALRPDTILAELTRLWTSLGQAAEQGDSHGVVRACALTFIVFAEEADDATAIGATLAELMREHPNRAIVVRVRPCAAALLEHRVLAQCWMPFGHREQICCEQIEITAAEGSLADLAPVLLALRAPDLPVVRWYRSARVFELQALPAPSLGVDKLIVDSASAAEPAAMLDRLARAAAGGHTLADLSWTRLTRWREIVAQVFESPAARALLPGIAQVRVFHAGQRVPPEARYLAAWVLGALGREIEVRFETVAGETIEGIELRGAVRISVRRAGDEAVLIEIDSLLNCAACPRPAESALLREELAILSRDPVYDKALRLAARIDGGERR